MSKTNGRFETQYIVKTIPSSQLLYNIWRKVGIIKSWQVFPTDLKLVTKNERVKWKMLMKLFKTYSCIVKDFFWKYEGKWFHSFNLNIFLHIFLWCCTDLSRTFSFHRSLFLYQFNFASYNVKLWYKKL